jgi:hypothetical protein
MFGKKKREEATIWQARCDFTLIKKKGKRKAGKPQIDCSGFLSLGWKVSAANHFQAETKVQLDNSNIDCRTAKRLRTTASKIETTTS